MKFSMNQSMRQVAGVENDFARSTFESWWIDHLRVHFSRRSSSFILANEQCGKLWERAASFIATSQTFFSLSWAAECNKMFHLRLPAQQQGDKIGRWHTLLRSVPKHRCRQQNLIVARGERQVIYARDIILLICRCERERECIVKLVSILRFPRRSRYSQFARAIVKVVRAAK